jgi:hypothetical protein
MFYRLSTDGAKTPVPLRDQWAGPFPSACWIIGAGPSLASAPIDRIVAAPIPRFAVNLAGTHLLRPHFWTAYDPTARFHRSTYFDPSILKFVHARRSMDLIPGTTFKVCDAPNLLFFDRIPNRGFNRFLDRDAAGIADWRDSFLQAIEIAYHLGFRRLYLVGCDMQVAPSAKLLELAQEVGVSHVPGEPLHDLLTRCRKVGLSLDTEHGDVLPSQYHFDEVKPLAAAVNTDMHYFRVVQWLRQSRRSLALAGLELISVTPGSRLNAFFPTRSIDDALDDIHRSIGDPAQETTRGRYTSPAAGSPSTPPMRDFRPLEAKPGSPAPSPAGKQATHHAERRTRLQSELTKLQEIEVSLNELG